MTRMRSVLIDAALGVHGTPSAWDMRASIHPCQGAKFHSPSPLITRKLTEVDLGRDVYLCPTCTENLMCFLHLAHADRQLDWPTLREFGNTLRELGNEALQAQGVDGG